jgi:succinate-semialdehyde dehydrogenase / glutarate-semialdehyde dehydrogenase
MPGSNMTSAASRSHDRSAPRQPSPDAAVKTADRGVLSSVNPYTGQKMQKMKEYLEMAPEDIDRAIANAHERFTAWRGVSFGQRASLLHRAAALCRERCGALATLMAAETGKRIAEGRKEVDLRRDF